MTATTVLDAARTALSTLAKADVMLGEVPMTPTRPYVVLTVNTPIPRPTLQSYARTDRVTLLVMAVSNSMLGSLMLAADARDRLQSLAIGGGLLRFVGGSSPIEEHDNPGDYRWSATWEYVVHVTRS